MTVDVSAFLGPYPWRDVPDTGVESLVAGLERDGVTEAWVSSLAAIFWRDPTAGNAALAEAASAHRSLRPVFAVQPEMAHRDRALHGAYDAAAPAVRCDPAFYGVDPVGADMRRLVAACGEAGLPLVLTVKLEDGRQRHPNDTAPDLTAAAVRALVRADDRVRLLVAHADRAFIEEVHFGSTPEESARIWWDIGWIWGPPEDHLALLLSTMGAERFVFGTARPLRLPESAFARLDLLETDDATRAAILHGNARRLAAT